MLLLKTLQGIANMCWAGVWPRWAGRLSGGAHTCHVTADQSCKEVKQSGLNSRSPDKVLGQGALEASASSKHLLVEQESRQSVQLLPLHSKVHEEGFLL